MVLSQTRKENAAGANENFRYKVRQILLPGNRLRLILGIALMLIQNMSEINGLNYYSPAIFEAIVFSGSSVQLLATGVFGIVKAATTLFLHAVRYRPTRS